MNLCERFPSLSPFDVRKQKFSDVFLLYRRMVNLNKRNEEKNGKVEVIGGKLYVESKNDDWW